MSDDELERATKCILCRRHLEPYEPFLPLLTWTNKRRAPDGGGAATVAAHFACFVEVIAGRAAAVTVEELDEREGERRQVDGDEERDDFADTVSAVVKELFRR